MGLTARIEVVETKGTKGETIWTVYKNTIPVRSFSKLSHGYEGVSLLDYLFEMEIDHEARDVSYTLTWINETEQTK